MVPGVTDCNKEAPCLTICFPVHKQIEAKMVVGAVINFIPDDAVAGTLRDIYLL